MSKLRTVALVVVVGSGIAFTMFCGVPVSGFVYFVYYSSCSSAGDCDRIPFESRAWQDESRQGSPEYVRIRMVDDLLKRHEFRGMQRSDVEALLGIPRPTDYFRAYDYVYWLGPERGLGVDSEWLCLKFTHDVVTEVRILRD